MKKSVIALCLCCTPALADDNNAMSVGRSTCAAWTAAVLASPNKDTAYTAAVLTWIQGYISAILGEAASAITSERVNDAAVLLCHERPGAMIRDIAKEIAKMHGGSATPAAQ
jgi:hypothetical protein